MGRRFALVLVAVFVLLSIGHAQDAKPAPYTDNPALTAQIVNPQEAPKPAAKPAPYTDVEALRIENVRLEGQIVQRAIADWQAKVKALKADLEKVRSGFTFNPETGEWAPVTAPAGVSK